LGTGEVSGGAETTDIWEYDPATNVWTSRAGITGVSRRAATAFSMNGKGYLGTGASSSNNALSDFYEYDPTNNTWVAKAVLPVGLFGAIGAATSNRGYVGGIGATGVLYEYDAATNTWSQRAAYPNTSGLYSAAFSLPNQRIYAGTGTSSGGTRTQSFFEYLPQ
jgi:N-acetylneuraminic acid mutarotase